MAKYDSEYNHDTDYDPNYWIAIAIDKSTGYYKTCTHCSSKEDAMRTAQYYRSVGYNARALQYEDACAYMDELYDKRKRDIDAWNRRVHYQQ